MGKLFTLKNQNPSVVNIDCFLGADLTNNPAYIQPQRSMDCPNMIRESAGKVRKWIGWHTVSQYDGQINGFHTFGSQRGQVHLIHAGTKLYMNGAEIYSGLKDDRSSSRQLGGKLIIADGKKLLMFYTTADGFVCQPVENTPFVPTVVICRTPSGGGIAYQPVNMLGKQRKDSFAGTETDKVYWLSATGIDSVDRIEKLNSEGGYDEITAYTVDTLLGKVTFKSAPGLSPVPEMDNVIITYSKTVAEYPELINSCDIMALYGLNGAMDRIFLSGNSTTPNKDYYCQANDPTYWGDSWCTAIGQENSRIMGYSVIGDKLATHINFSDNDTNIMLRSGSQLADGSVVFKLAGSYQGSGAVSKYAFSTLETEPLFLTDSGIMAVTPSDVLGERYAQLRSYYLNGLLLKQNLSQAVSTIYDRFYMLAVGGYIFALDGTQASVERNMPYSSRQYAGFYRTNVNARVLANIDGVLTFGTADGKVCQFYTDYTDVTNYNDDGATICAKWTTPEILGESFYSKKRFRKISVMLGAATATSVRAQVASDGVTQLIMDYNTGSRYFMWSRLNWAKFTWKNDTTSQILTQQISIKPTNRKAHFILENDIVDEPLGLYGLTIEFTETRG